MASGIWVFGYGSLVWNPGFDFVRSQIGHIRGFERRFWQGNDKHRGTPEKIGRVATLIESKEGIVWGRAFLLRPDDRSSGTSLSYLDERESKLGGYGTTLVQFQPRDPREDPVPALVYVALPGNPLYLGPASVRALADQIATSRGPSGSNAEYVLRLARFMREEVPGIWDDHLFALESSLLVRLEELKMTDEMTSSSASDRDFRASLEVGCKGATGEDKDVATDARNSPVTVAVDFVSAVSSTKLRCLDL
uniref:glutathione-specific gamma-glutamylcyclotransferase n=1 Tax=Ixodes ricinus TaxID=34613 RepID=A0A131Y2T0_IXORI